ncbi:hypothetical protein [Mesorhizobium argentiipisi]|uniref:Uncharacterized protein n=1 Tax=Mesorhizobium argentiipisi TaxID=3015175 RepID=A0ABU8KET8_9HYPH
MKARNRDTREAQGLAYIRRNRCASALEIGQAAIQGEARSREIPWRAKEAIGLSIAIELARKGKVTPTRGNQFRLA